MRPEYPLAREAQVFHLEPHLYFLSADVHTEAKRRDASTVLIEEPQWPQTWQVTRSSPAPERREPRTPRQPR